MKRYPTLLFDLDGTLTDSAPGIVNCVRHALTRLNQPIPDEATLRQFVGPPLMVGFQTICGMSEAEAEQGTAAYRERFGRIGLFENDVYDGIPELLRDLKTAGYTLAVATSKPEVFTVRILAHFGLTEYFDAVAGCSLVAGETKADMIEKALAALHCTDRSQVLMIGDRHYDISGAKTCGIDSVGVGYGYAEENELEDAGADYICPTVEDLRRFLLS